MIAIDTNVVLRYLLNDDKVQSQKAASLVKRHKRILITDVVLAETVWTLKGRKYKLDQSAISDVLNALFAEPGICFEDDQVVWRALNDFIGAEGSQSRPRKTSQKMHIDFADALIINKARKYAEHSGHALEAVYSFDTAALGIKGVKQP